MRKNHKLLSSLLMMLLFFPAFLLAGSVKFPSQVQPGNASLTESNGRWTFSNSLFEASYKLDNGKLFFDGSPEMNLDAGNEIFEIVLGDNTKVKASEMNWGTVETETLQGNDEVLRFSERLDGKALKVTLTYETLTLKWRAVLRDGSHYLRTELEISTTANTPMTSITPMLYTVINEEGRSEPVVVGNTRGAVIASDHIFAGVETPLAFNMVSSSFNPNFNVNSWVSESWLHFDGTVPTPILNQGLAASDVVVSEGDVNVTEGGTWTFKFQYSSGSHRLNMVGVDLVNEAGQVVASDYHFGYTGHQFSNNTYTLQIPEAGNYKLRYFSEIKSESIDSKGSITVAKSGAVAPDYNPYAWVPADWKAPSSIPAEILAFGFNSSQVVSIEGNAKITAGTLNVKFQYTAGNHRMNLTGVDILDAANNVVASDYHIGFTGGAASDNTYTIEVPETADYTLRYFGETKTETINSNGDISFTGSSTVTVAGAGQASITALPKTETDPLTIISGKWSRKTTLQTTDTFRVSAVVGLVAKDQQRRSFLAYHERERAVPWRSFVIYNSWYELNIDRNNDPNPLNRMTEGQCLPIIDTWKENLFDTHGIGIDAFVWDDGWDDFNSLWDFHIGFPNGFEKLDERSRLQNAGTGAWLGPVGGYGSSKQQRLNFWNSTHSPAISNFELSNKEYFDAFINRCSQMVDDYDMRFFKFDGISDFFSATGPKNEEDAEGIISVLKELRKKREDLFFNTTVGTWASPFWFQFTDAVWRHENDFDMIGNQGNARERWITYRDRLVHQNFVTNSPLCPINSLMTHGLMVTKYGPPAQMPRSNTEVTYKGIIREMRCAFASGTEMVELYVDNDLMSTIGNNKVLWKDLAESIEWHRNNADVLADVHWVGGNPWDGSKAHVYGWASWNEHKSTLALRNPSQTTQAFTTTLREAFDIPPYITGKIKLTDAFSNQVNYAGITGEEIDIDTEITFNMPAFDVVVFDGRTVGAGTNVNSVDQNQNSAFVSGLNKRIALKNVELNAMVQVVDAKGSMVKQTTALSSEFNIPMFQNGVYIVKIMYANGGREVHKVVCR